MTKSDRVRFSLRFPATLHEKLVGEAERREMSINALLVEIIWKYMHEKNRPSQGRPKRKPKKWAEAALTTSPSV